MKTELTPLLVEFLILKMNTSLLYGQILKFQTAAQLRPHLEKELTRALSSLDKVLDSLSKSDSFKSTDNFNSRWSIVEDMQPYLLASDEKMLKRMLEFIQQEYNKAIQ